MVGTLVNSEVRIEGIFSLGSVIRCCSSAFKKG